MPGGAILRFYRILFVLAGALFFAGFALLDAGLDFDTALRGEETFQIRAGSGWYYVVELPMQEGGRVHIVFEETSERAINVRLFPQRDYEAYQSDGIIQPNLPGTSGSSGTFAINIRTEGTYYLVFEHTPQNTGVPQEVQLRYSFTGVQPQEPDWLLVGLGAASLVGGAVAVTGAARGRLRAVGKSESVPPATRV